MTRQRGASIASTTSTSASAGAPEQELSSMYDYLAKIILLGPSGCGKSCLLHRFVKDEWRVLTSQTIGVEFASKIVKVGTGPRRKRIKLQLWDTAGTERFRSVSRSYYRNAAGAILVYDITQHNSFRGLPTFLHDARSLASPNLTVVLAGNKNDLADENRADPRDQPAASLLDQPGPAATPAPPTTTIGTRNTLTVAPDGRAVTPSEAASWSQTHSIATSVEVSAYTGDGVDELFAGLARTILARIELGEIDPDDPGSGLQYGDSGWDRGGGFGAEAGEFEGRRGGRGKWSLGFGGAASKSAGRGATGSWRGMREWEEVFQLNRRKSQRRCC